MAMNIPFAPQAYGASARADWEDYAKQLREVLSHGDLIERDRKAIAFQISFASSLVERMDESASAAGGGRPSKPTYVHA